MSTYQTLLTHADAGVLRITINRPDKLNALNQATIAELDSVFRAAKADPEVRVVTVTGAGAKAFIAGADISELADATPIQVREFALAGQRMMRGVELLGKPVVAAINGFALGGGLEFAMSCHLRIAADTAKIGQPEINLGLLPGFGGSQRLLRLTSRAAALELCLLGTPIPAARGHALGILNQVVPADQLIATVDAIAAQLAASAPMALRGILDAILIGGECAMDQGLEFEAQAFAVCSATDDMREGTRAFLEKRKAQFNGR